MKTDNGLPPTIPPPKWIENVTCYNPKLVNDITAPEYDPVTIGNVLMSMLLLATSFITVLFNSVFIMVINSDYYLKYVKRQPRYLLIAMALNELATGISILFGVYPAIFECWPFGRRFCQVQALLRGAITQQSALILIILAMERYLATVHPLSYATICNAKVCLFAVLLSWLCSLSLYGMIALPSDGFHFNVNGLMLCEPYYLSNNVLILTSCLFYFPTTMLLMYFYGTIFHSTKAKLASKTKYKNVIFSTFPTLMTESEIKRSEKRILEDKLICETTSKSTAAISLTFIIVVTPWAIQQVITSCTKTTAPAYVDFCVSWLATSRSFWSPLIYWLLNDKFRRSALHFYITKVRCFPFPLSFSTESDLESDNSPVDFTIQEKLWGEILDRTVSSHNLQMIQAPTQQNNNNNNHAGSAIIPQNF